MMKDFEVKDVAIIGAGPVGIFSVFAFGMQGLKSVLIDSLDKIGGQCSVLYPEKNIYDIPGFKSITGAHLVDKLYEQAKVFKPEILLNSFVENIEYDEVFKLKIGHDFVFAKSVVIALGAGQFQPVKPDIPNLELFEDKNIFYFMNDIKKFAGKKVAILGAGDSALDWALELHKLGSKVYLIHRREFVKAHPATWQEVLASDISIKIPYHLNQLIIKDNQFCGIEIASEDKLEELDVDYLLPCFGMKNSVDFLQKWNLELINGKFKVNQANMQTSQAGIYAIGDCAYYENKRKLIALGFAESFLCASHIFSYLYPEKAPLVGHSTSLGVPV